jgi:hypothetical protein
LAGKTNEATQGWVVFASIAFFTQAGSSLGSEGVFVDDNRLGVQLDEPEAGTRAAAAGVAGHGLATGVSSGLAAGHMRPLVLRPLVLRPLVWRLAFGQRGYDGGVGAG